MRTTRLLDHPRFWSTSVMPPLSRRGRAATAAVLFTCVVKLLVLSYLAVTASGGLALGARLGLVMALGGAAACGIICSIVQFTVFGARLRER